MARMSVSIDSGPVTADLKLKHVSQNKWRELLIERRRFLHTRLPYDCRRLLEFVQDAEAMYSALGYVDVHDLIKRGFDLDPDQVNWAVEGLRRMEPNKPIPFERAIELGKHGTNRHSRVGNTKSRSDGG